MEIEIRRNEKGRKTLRRVVTPLRRVSIGRDLSNHLILLDRNAAPREGLVVREGLSIFWQSEPGGERLRCSFRFVDVGSYKVRAQFPLRSALLLLALVVFGAFWIRHRGFVQGTPDSAPSDAGRIHRIQLPARGEYGNVKHGSADSGAVFEFVHVGARPVELHFSTGNIEGADQLAIRINGRTIGFSAPSAGRWGVEEIRLVRPELLREGTNKLRFVTLSRPSGSGIWGVRNIYVSDGDGRALDSSEQLKKRAEKFFEQRNAQSGNLWRAKTLLLKARELKVAEGGKVPPDWEEFSRSLRQTEDFLVSRRISEARAALSLGDERKAKEIVRNAMAEFVDPLDPRRPELREAWKEMSR